MKKFLLLSSCFIIVGFGVNGCAISQPSAPPQLTFANYAPVYLNVSQVQILDGFRGKSNSSDVSGQFVMPPNEAIKTYASRRFQNNGMGDGQFILDIEESFVNFRQIKEDSKVLRATGFGTEDEYRVFVQVRVTAQPSGFNGRQSTTIKMDRTLVMPSSVTLAERDMRQTKFLETLISDLDKRVNEAIDLTPAIRG